MKRNNLFLIAGHNGAGKTTFLKEFVKIKKLKYINPDEIAQKISIDKFSLLTIKAGKITLKRIEKLKKEKEDFIVETTLSGKIWKTLISDFKKNNYHITLFFIYLDTPEEAIKRVAIRINKKGHYVSKEDIYRRYFRSIKNFWYIYKSLVDEWFLINNSGKIPYLIANGTKDNYQILDNENFDKFLLIVKNKEER
jgi:predicted ABC-type ATPase